MINSLVNKFSKAARVKRAAIFKQHFKLDQEIKILDLGSEDGSHIYSIIADTSVKPENVYIADIDAALIAKGALDYGFNPVLIDETKPLPFADNFFDVVYCSSVIEHVTIPKAEIWTLLSDAEFKARSFSRQSNFANEIKRLGKNYFIQTPYKHFLIESHSWLPCLAWLPRKILIPVLKFSNKIWVKKTTPDWYLLDKKELFSLFNDALITSEKFWGLTKSIMAIKTDHHQLNLI